MKVSLAAIKRLVKTGAAEDVTNVDLVRRPWFSTVVFYSVGRDGLNGLILRDDESGDLLAVIGRCSNLFLLAH